MMAVISIAVGIFVLRWVFNCPENEIKDIYARMGVRIKEKEDK